MTTLLTRRTQQLKTPTTDSEKSHEIKKQNIPSNKIKSACDNNWDKYKSDCSGFLKAVAGDFGINLAGQANTIIDTMNHAPWLQLNTNSNKAVMYANLGYLVVAGQKATPNGHVAIIMPHSSQPYPTAYWGRLGGIGRKNTTINWAWKHADLVQVQYFARPL